MAGLSIGRKTWLVAGLVVAAFAAGFGLARLTAAPPATPSAQAAKAGEAWSLFGKPRAADAPRAAPRKPDGFTVWTSRLDARGSAPSACIRMTRGLDPRKSYGDFVSVSPALAHPAAVTVQGDELCVADVGYAGRTVTLLRGLPSAGGETLAENTDVEFVAGAKPTYVGFSGEGVILPREDADGVGLETVNVTRLHLEVWRVTDRNLVRKQIAAPQPTAEGEYSEDDVGDDGRKVWEGDMAVHGTADQRTTTVFPLGAVLKTLQSGAYVVVARDATGLRGAKPRDGETDDQRPAAARRWILFTDMALQAYDGSDALDVVVRSLKTARALGGVRLALVAADGEELASALSDATGRVRFARALLGGESGAKPMRVMAYGPKTDFTLLDLERSPVDLSKQDVGGRSPPGAKPATGADVAKAASAVDGFVYTDRGIYRPGETVHVVGLLRDRLAHAVTDRRGALVVRRPSGLEFARYPFKATPGGSAAADVVLPAGAPRAVWRVSLEMDGADGASGSAAFQVEDFAPQRLAVTVGADADRPVLGGETRKVQIGARFLYGAVASGLAVTSEARISADPDPFPAIKGYVWGDQQKPFDEKLIEAPHGQTDAGGRAIAPLDLKSLGQPTDPLRAQITASVFEPGGRPVAEQATVKLHLRPLYLGVKSTPGLGADPVQTFEVVAASAQGQRIAAPHVHYLLISERWNYDWFESGGRWSWRRTSRDIPIAEGFLAIGAGGPARITKKLPWGDYRLVLDDAATGAHTVIRQSAGWADSDDGVEAPDTARVSAVRTGYRTGDDVEIRIQAPFAGEAQVAVAGDRLISLKSVTLGANGGSLHLRAGPDWGGGAYVLVTVVQPRDPVSSPKPRRAVGLVYVPLEPPGRKLSVAIDTPTRITSHAPVTATLNVRGLTGGQTAHVTLAAVDEGILRLTHWKNPDPAGWYFGKRALGLAYRDDYGRLLDPNLGAAGAVSFGGDEVGGAGLAAVPIRSVALWSGVVTTDASGRATVRLPAADFNGQLRLVAVAWTDSAVGSGVSNLIVREPVVAEVALPRFLAPGDRAEATVELDNVEGRAGPYLANLIGRDGPTAAAGRSFNLQVGQHVTERLSLIAGNRPSIGQVSLDARGPGFAALRSFPLQTRAGWGQITRAFTTLQKPGESYTPSATLLTGLAADATLSVSYSPFANFDPTPIATALSRYPYGCSEQLASTGYAALFAVASGGGPKARMALAASVSKLLDREALDGSFGLWRVGDGEADPWTGAFVVDFLLDARAMGALVPDEALARALSAMRAVSQTDGYTSVGYRMQTYAGYGRVSDKDRQATERLRSRAAAYALYVMAKSGHGDLGRLRWFHDVGFDKEPSALARAQIGAALAAMGDHGRAHDSFAQAVQAKGWKSPDDGYQSPLRDLAGVVALAYEAGETGVARSLQGRLERTVRQPDRLNTQEQSHLLKAARAMLAAAGPVKVQASGATPDGTARWAVGKLSQARFVNSGAGGVWRTVTIRGTPLAAPGASENGMLLQKSLVSVAGRPVKPEEVVQGQRLIVRIAGQLLADRQITAVIDDALPAGFEIESVLTPADAQGAVGDNGKVAAGPFAFLGKLTPVSVQEKRDDRYVAALRAEGSQTFVVAYVVRAVTPGDFFLPGAVVQDMYRPAVNARTAPGRTRIAPLP